MPICVRTTDTNSGKCSRTSKWVQNTEAHRKDNVHHRKPGMLLLKYQTTYSTVVTSAARMAARAMIVGLCTG